MPTNGDNSKLGVLTALATSGDTWVKLGTLALVALSGLGNFFATNKQGEQGRIELDRLRQEVRDEVREIHRNQDAYVDNVRRVKENQELLRQLVESNDTQLRNQGTMLDNQRRALDVLQAGQKRFFGGGNEHP